MKTAILATLFASAAAFAPVSQKTSSTSLKAFENEVGARKYNVLELFNKRQQVVLRFEKIHCRLITCIIG